MNPPNGQPELRRRLDDLQDRIRQKADQLETREILSRDHREKIDEMHARTEALRARLQGVQPSSWAAMKNEIESEWQALINTFDEWADHVDRSFQHRP